MMGNRGGSGGAIAAALVLLAGATAAAQPLVPDEVDDPELGALAAQYDRQFFTFNARPFGLSLDGFYDPAQAALIEGFFAQGEPFETYAGAHPFTALTGYGEHGDLGMFGGVAAVGDALRYVVLRDGGAAADRVAEARAEVKAGASKKAYRERLARAAQDRAAEALEKERAAEARRIEEQRLKELEAEADRWFRARRLRECLDAVEETPKRAGRLQTGGDLEGWLQQARAAADRLDPLVRQAWLASST